MDHRFRGVARICVLEVRAEGSGGCPRATAHVEEGVELAGGGGMVGEDGGDEEGGVAWPAGLVGGGGGRGVGAEGWVGGVWGFGGWVRHSG
jgi:hypothetical protein